MVMIISKFAKNENENVDIVENCACGYRNKGFQLRKIYDRLIRILYYYVEKAYKKMHLRELKNCAKRLYTKYNISHLII